MLDRKALFEKVMSLRPDLTEDDLRRLIQKKMEGAGHLLTEEGATYMVANELGIELSNGRVVKTGMKVKDLIIGANDATIIGRVIAVSPVQTFVRRDGVEGKVSRLVVADDTGRVNVVLWNEKTSLVSRGKVVPNQVVRVSHGYVRGGLNGSPELNLNQRGTVIVLSEPTSDVERPVSDLKKIRDLKEEGSFVSFIGVVKSLSQPSSFKRADNREGQVGRARLVDDTGRIGVVFWDEKVDYVKKSRRGDVLKVSGGQVRRGLGNALEVHVGRFGQVELLKESEASPLTSLILTKISDLRPGMNDVDVLGRVVDLSQIREFDRPSGGKGRVGSLFLMDEKGSARLNLWDAKADMLNEVRVGDVVLVEGGYTREGLGGTVDLNLGGLGSLTINPKMEEAQTLPPPPSNTMTVGELKVGMGKVFIEGEVVEEPIIKDVTTRSGEDLRVASLRIRDETGEVRVSLWRDLADMVKGLAEGATLRIKNAYVKMGFDGGPELSSGFTTEVEILKKGDVKPEKPFDRTQEGFPKKISELEDGERTEVQGIIVEINPNSRVYPSCPNCRKRVKEEEGAWACDRCGAVPKPVPRLIVDATVEDDSGRISSVFSGSVAEELLGMKGDYAWNISIQAGNEAAPVDTVRNRITGIEVQITGRVRRSQRNGDLRLYVEKFKQA